MEVICPLSGLMLSGVVIPMHKMAMFECENGSIFARCPNHIVRSFISDFTTVKAIMSQATVVNTTWNTGKRKKENADGKTQERGSLRRDQPGTSVR
jgi:hypothetical protein